MDLKTTADTVHNIVTSSAVIIGGVWVYFKFIRGRTFAHRGELQVSPVLESNGNSLHLSVTIRFKNTGLSKIPLNPNMTFLYLFGITGNTNNGPYPATWEEIPPISQVFDQHAWVEGQESVEDTVVYNLPVSDRKVPGHVAYKVEAQMAAPRRLITRKGTRWQARAVVFLASSNPTNYRSMFTNTAVRLATSEDTEDCHDFSSARCI